MGMSRSAIAGLTMANGYLKTEMGRENACPAEPAGKREIREETDFSFRISLPFSVLHQLFSVVYND